MAELPQQRVQLHLGNSQHGLAVDAPAKPRGYDRGQNTIPAIYNDGRKVHDPRHLGDGAAARHAEWLAFFWEFLWRMGFLADNGDGNVRQDQ